MVDGRSLPDLLDALYESHLVLQPMGIPLINGLQSTDAIMHHPDTVLRLNQVFYSSKVGLLTGSLYDGITLDGISLLHRK